MNSPFKNDIFSLIYRAFKNIYPDKECECFWYPDILKDENGNTVYGLTNFDDDGTITVFVTATLTVNNSAEILAHELAHVASGAENEHNEKWEKAFDNIFNEYNKIADELFN